MVPFIISLIALVPAIKAMCYSPMIHGFAPDVILPSVFSSEVYCPPPHVFDHFVCMCVDPSVVTLPVPREARTSYEVSLLGAKRLAGNPSYRIAQLAGLPDMHVPGRTAVSWGPVNGYSFGGSSGTARRVVPALNPYGSFNMPANSNAAVKAAAKAKLMEAATLPIKQQEILEKIRWREQLQRESAAAAAAAAELAVAAAAAAVPGSSSVGGGSALDGFMRDTLRRILYGY